MASTRQAPAPSASGSVATSVTFKQRRFRRTAAVLSVAIVAALMLSGCVKLDMALSIQSNDTVDGTVVFAVDKSLLELSGKSAEEAWKSGSTSAPFPTSATSGSVTTTVYDQDGKYGETYTFAGVPLSEFDGTSATGKDDKSLTIVHQGDYFVVSGVIDMSQASQTSSGSSASAQPIPAALLKSFEIKIALTFPGEVVEHTGTLDGTTVTWAPQGAEKVVISAKAKDTADVTLASVVTKVLPWAVAALVLLGLALLLVLFLRRAGGSRSPADQLPDDGLPAAPTGGAPPTDLSFAPPAPTVVAPPAQTVFAPQDPAAVAAPVPAVATPDGVGADPDVSPFAPPPPATDPPTSPPS